MMRDQWMNAKRDLSKAEEGEGERWDVKVVAGNDEDSLLKRGLALHRQAHHTLPVLQ